MLPEDPGAVDEVSGPAAVLVLAILQGVTEFLPVSSSGHLALGRAAMGVEEAGLTLDVALHLGTLAAVIWAYRVDVRRLFADLFAGRLRMWGWLILATVPIAVVGLAVKDLIAEAAESPRVAGLGLLCTAVLLLIGESRRPVEPEGGEVDRDDDGDDGFGRPRWSDALVLGCAQTLAILPGISRSGTTIATAFVRRIPARQAARLSFLMSLPAVSGAALVELPGAATEGFGGLSTFLVAGAAFLAALVGWAALRTLLLVLSRGAFRWFAAYCALLGGLALVFLGS